MKHFNKYVKILQTFIAIAILLNGITVNADFDYIIQGFPINKDIDDRRQYIEGEYIVKYKDSISEYEKINIYKQEKIELVESQNEINVDKIEVKGGLFLKSKIRRLQRNPKIEYIEPNYLYYPMELSNNEPRFNELWGLENTGQDIRNTSGVPNVDIDILDAWQYTKGSEDVVVAIIDTGIDTSHPDLKDNIWYNIDEKLNNEDSDGNGYIDDMHGWDFLNDDNSVYDYEDGDHHGTHVAGIIAASINNIGIAGVAPNIKIMPLKFLGIDEYGETVGTLSDVLKAIEYAKNKGAKIVNASWGNYEHSQLLEDAIANSGMLFLAASGNETINTDIKSSYPANFDLPNIISIGAVNNKGEYANFSNYGNSTVHVAAPGVDILSSIPLNRYKSAAIYSEGINYKTLFQAFGLEMINVEHRLNIMEKTLNALGLSERDSILLVQDDESSNLTYKNSLEYYKSPLDELGFLNLDIYKVNQHHDGPDFDKMKDYDLVIWFTGEGFGLLNGSITAITKNDQENLIAYLEKGGKLYLSGRDAGEKIEKARLFKDYLNVEFKSEIDAKSGLWKNILIGEAGTKFEQAIYFANNTEFADIINPINNGKISMVYGSSNTFYNSYMYMGGTSMATPYVSGIAALLYSLGENDILSIRSLIMRGIKPIEGLEHKTLTGGIVSATRSINKYINGQVNYVKAIDIGVHNLELDTKISNEYKLQPSITPLNANDKRIKWISSDEAVVTVDEDGNVKAIGKGKAIITAITIDGAYIDSCKVLVKEYNYPAAVDNVDFHGSKIVVNLKKISGDIEGTVIIQAYDKNNRPLKIKYSNREILRHSYEFDFGHIIQPIEYLQIYIWDGLDSMKPLADKFTINIK